MALCHEARDLHVDEGGQPSPTNNPSSIQRDFDFVKRPSQDFFCPVSLELLLEPQLTSCCGHHLSIEVATRLQREGKPCPMCNGEQWSAVLDKYHRRRVQEVRVRCWHKDNGCGWVGEINGLKRHTDSCELRPWECEYCGLKCTYGEGEGKHWPTCHKFPEPCPNSCEVVSVERCNMEQHRSVCPLEPVSCEMKEFGCSVVVPRKELATHMKESELQHLTAMTMLNLRLTKQLQQDSTERDKKIAQLQEEQKKLQTEMKTEMKMKMDEIRTAITHEQKQMQAEVNTRIDEQKRELKTDIKRLEHITHHIEQHTSCRICTVNEVFTFTQYSKRKCSGCNVFSDPFYTHHHGYKFQLRIRYYTSSDNVIVAYLYLINGEYDDQLNWPVEVKVQLELLNQNGDHHHVVRTKNMKWNKDKRDTYKTIDGSLMKYSDLEKSSDGVQYMMNDCLKFRLHVTIL